MFDFLTQNYINRGFWGDEAWTALLSQESITEIIRVTSEDFHPPLYYFVTHFWIGAFGSSEIAVRLLSTLFFVLATVAAFWFARTIRNTRFAILATLLILTSPILTTYAFEARSYGLLAFLSILVTYLFWQTVLTKEKRYFIFYTLIAIAGLYTHYYFGFVLFSHSIFAVFINRKNIFLWLGAYVIIALGYLPWLPTLLSQVSGVKQSYWIGAINERTHYEFYLRLLTGDFETKQRMFILWSGTSLLITSMFLAIRNKIQKSYIFLWLLLIITVLVPSLISLVFTPVFFYRYLVFLYIPLAFLIVWGLEKYRFGVLFLCIFLLMQTTITVSGLTKHPYTMREELTKVNYQAEESDTLATVLNSFAEVAYYNKGERPLYILPENIVQFSGKSLLDSFARSGKVIIGYPPQNQPYWLIKPGPKSEYVKNNIQ